MVKDKGNNDADNDKDKGNNDNKNTDKDQGNNDSDNDDKDNCKKKHEFTRCNAEKIVGCWLPGEQRQLIIFETL